VSPQGIREAAYLLMSAVPAFAPGTVHLVVVDPGVGSERRAVAARSGPGLFVGPDNGVLSWALGPDAEVVAVEREDLFRQTVSATFHGRDIFAPVAAHLSAGISLAEMGPAVSDWERLSSPRLETRGPVVHGEILHVDRFGNVITSVPGTSVPSAVRAEVRIEAGEIRVCGLKNTYADGDAGEVIAYIGSNGYIELARVGGSAADGSGLAPGSDVTVQLDAGVPDERSSNG
jgi:S-adenosylmethionine hydrolase